MSSDTERVMRAMQDMRSGNAAGVKLKFDPGSRRIVPVDDHGRRINHDSDRFTELTPKDMEHFGGDERWAQ